MELAQTFETVVVSNSGEFAELIFVPARSLSDFDERRQREPIPARELRLQLLSRMDPTQLKDVISLMLSTPYSIGAYPENPQTGHLGKVSDEHREFAEQLCNQPLVPYEESPLQVKSLATIATSPVAAGTFIGIAVAGLTPLLYISVPAGIVVCYVADGIGKGLRQGLKNRLYKMLRKK